MPDRGKALLDRRRRSLTAQLIDVGRDLQRLHVGDRSDTGTLAPSQEFPRRLGVSAPRVFVADLRAEELPKANLRALTGGRDQD